MTATTMTTDLTIPLQYAEWMRHAALQEIKSEAERLADQVVEAKDNLSKADFESRFGLREREPLDRLLGDANGTLAGVREALAAAGQVLNEQETISGTPSALAYILDAFCRTVIPAQLKGHHGPLEGDEGVNCHEQLVEALQWASQEMTRLRDAEERRRLEVD